METVTSTLAGHARAWPAKPAIVHVQPSGEIEITWERLHERATSWGQALLDGGAEPGSPVLIFLPHCPELYYAFFGAMSAGLVPSYMPLPTPKQRPDLYWSSHKTLVERIKPAAIITTAHDREQMLANDMGMVAERILDVAVLAETPVLPRNGPAPQPADIALLQHSSGTTGTKKGVMLSHRAILTQVEAYAECIGLTPDKCIVSWLPLYHDMGLIACLVSTIVMGNKLVIMDPFHWLNRPGRLFDLAKKHGAQFMWLPNFAFEHLANTVRSPDRYDLSGIEAFVSCSEVAYERTMARFVKHFAPAGVRAEQCSVSYAMAETVFAATQTPIGRPFHALHVQDSYLSVGTPVTVGSPEDHRQSIMSCGPPLPGVTIRIVDEKRNELPDGTVGEIEISASFLFDGYLALPERTADKLVDGRYYSSDLGFRLDGEIYVLGRADDVLILNGKNIFANEVEAALAGIVGIKPGRLVCLGWEDRSIGSQRMIIMAERLDEATPDDFSQAKEEISGRVSQQFGVDVHDIDLLEVGALYKTTSGKISRKLNLELYEKRVGSRADG